MSLMTLTQGARDDRVHAGVAIFRDRRGGRPCQRHGLWPGRLGLVVDRDRAFEVAARLNAGTVWVNKHLDLGPDIPYAGAKQSGIGTELSQEGLEAFTPATIINIAK